jgi:hypothetical protein
MSDQATNRHYTRQPFRPLETPTKHAGNRSNYIILTINMIESIIYLLLLSLVPLTSAELIALVLQSSDQFLILPGEQILLEQARALGIDIRGLSAIEETLEGLSQKLSDNLGVSLRRKNKAAVISRDGDALESAPRSVKRPKSSAGKDKQPIPAKIKRAPFSNEVSPPLKIFPY